VIKQLTYTVTFPTGRTLTFNQNLPKGSVAITGRNEAGKSMVIEMVRYGLFGAGALRGPMTDYKSLKMSMTFVVRGVEFSVERTSSNAKLSDAGGVVATGTSPVNKKILEIFGYDLTVFDTANVAGQGDVEALGKMKPSERKLMVDRLIGADRIDELNAWANGEALLLKKECEVLERGLVKPEAPQVPEGYCATADDLAVEVERLMALKSEQDQLQGWLTREIYRPEAPTPVSGDADAISEAIQLLSLPVIDYDPEEVSRQWVEHDRWLERQRFMLAHPRPSMSLDHCQLLTEEAGRQERVVFLQKQIATLQKAPKLTCPCGKEFTLQDGEIEKVKAELEKLGPLGHEIDMRFVRSQLDMLRDWDTPSIISGWNAVADAVQTGKPAHPRTAPARALSHAQRAAVVSVHGDDVAVLKRTLECLRAYDRATAVYQQRLTEYEAYVAERDIKTARFVALKLETDRLALIVPRLQQAREYERAVAAYAVAKQIYEDRIAQITELQEQRDGWAAVKEGFGEIRTKIKTHLVPSLNRVASHLLAQMTGGQRSQVVVDENFDVSVDGQKLATLSGSGKACANLALRIGLGQVLTNNVFSVFVGDEIDASMDEDRSEFTQNSLKSLSDKISQVIIITHKPPTADHVIEL